MCVFKRVSKGEQGIGVRSWLSAVLEYSNSSASFTGVGIAQNQLWDAVPMHGQITAVDCYYIKAHYWQHHC